MPTLKKRFGVVLGIVSVSCLMMTAGCSNEASPSQTDKEAAVNAAKVSTKTAPRRVLPSAAWNRRRPKTEPDGPMNGVSGTIAVAPPCAKRRKKKNERPGVASEPFARQPKNIPSFRFRSLDIEKKLCYTG